MVTTNQNRNSLYSKTTKLKTNRDAQGHLVRNFYMNLLFCGILRDYQLQVILVTQFPLTFRFACVFCAIDERQMVGYGIA